MSKATFFSILKSSPYSEVDMELCWKSALDANLPIKILELLKPHLAYLPDVHGAYMARYGYSPLNMTEEKATKIILESFIDGSRTALELHKMFSISKEMRIKILEKLIRQKIVVFKFCPIVNRIIYDLNNHISISRTTYKRVHDCVSRNQKITLNELYLRDSLDKRNIRAYSDLCMVAKRILTRTTGDVSVFYNHENVIFQIKE